MKQWIAAMLLLASVAQAEIVSKPVEYKDGDIRCVGVLVYDNAVHPRADALPRPGVLVIPEWWGLTEYPKTRAKQLAELGYVAFVADMYGEGKTTNDPKQAAEWAAIRNDRPALRQRALAALTAMRASAAEARLDPARIAAIGYCFGGTTVLELARGNADVAGVVSFHGGLELPGDMPAEIKPKILICHGAADPMVPPKEVQTAIDQLHAAKADFQFIAYSHAAHSFTNPAASKLNIPGIGYDEKADARSWEAMQAFLREATKR